MGRQRPTPPGKRRTREHVLADLSINHVERQVLLCGFSVERTRYDYGYDLTMATYNEGGESEPGAVYFQVKATDQLPWLKGGKTISWPLSRRDLSLWFEEVCPVILIVYDGGRERAYWLDVQSYFSGYQTAELFASGETIHAHVPARNRFNRRALREIARYKNDFCRRVRAKETDRG